MIPKILHRIWLDEEVPERWNIFWRAFGIMNPGWELVTWDDSTQLDFLRCRETFDQQTTHAGRADVLRYELLWRFGGVYVDTDVEPLRPLDGLIGTDDRAFIAWENDWARPAERLLCPTVIGAPPGHPALDALLTDLPRWAHRHRRSPPNIRTGPNFLTPIWRRRSDVRRLPTVSCYPVHWSRRADLGGPYPAESFMVHHWNQGWDPIAKARIDARGGSSGGDVPVH